MELQRIAALYADPGPFASAYVEVSRTQEAGDRLAELQARSARDALVEQSCPEALAQQVYEALAASTHEGGTVSRCVVASERGVLLDELTHRHVPQPVAAYDVLPELGAWLADESLLVPHIFVLVDHRGGTVTTFASDASHPDAEADVTEVDPEEHKFHGGGWGHLRMQHNTENIWYRHQEEVATELRRQLQDGPDLVVLAGDPQARPKLLEALGQTQATVVQIEGGSRSEDGGDEALQAALQEALRGQVVARILAELHELRERLGQGTRVATGVDDVVAALVQGQVDRLYLDPAAAAEFELSVDAHPGLTLGAIASTGELRADRVLVAAACLTDAELVVAHTSQLIGTPVAAILRWDQSAEGDQG
jgi:release factor family 2